MKSDEPHILPQGKVQSGDIGIPHEDLLIRFYQVEVYVAQHPRGPESPAGRDYGLNLRIGPRRGEISSSVAVFARQVSISSQNRAVHSHSKPEILQDRDPAVERLLVYRARGCDDADGISGNDGMRFALQR